MAYIFGKISREQAEEQLGEATDGKFLLRTRDPEKFPGDYVLCVAFKNKPTHHLVTKGEDGQYTINKKSFGDFTDVTQLISHLNQKRPGWPVPLTNPVKNPEKAKAAKKASTKKKDGTLKKKKPLWLHGPLSKDEAEDIMKAEGLSNGRFLVRSRAGKKTDFVLGVIFKGNPTHHLIMKDEASGSYVINKKSYGIFKTMQKLIEHLMTPGVPKWPIQLANPYNRAAPAGEDAAPERPAAAKPAAAEPEPAPAPAPEPEPEPEPPAASEPAASAVTGEAATAPAPAAAASAAVGDGGMSIDMIRVMCRAVINIGSKMHAFESQVNEFNQQLTMLEQFALEARQAAAAQQLANAMMSPPPAGRSLA